MKMEQILKCLLAIQEEMRTNQAKKKAEIGAEIKAIQKRRKKSTRKRRKL
jgi:hypothetical protein